MGDRSKESGRPGSTKEDCKESQAKADHDGGSQRICNSIRKVFHPIMGAIIFRKDAEAI
jgi:hypothetical protein